MPTQTRNTANTEFAFCTGISELTVLYHTFLGFVRVRGSWRDDHTLHYRGNRYQMRKPVQANVFRWVFHKGVGGNANGVRLTEIKLLYCAC